MILRNGIMYKMLFDGGLGDSRVKVSLEKAVESDAEFIFEIQIKAFLPILEKYKDFETNPANESVERVIRRINNPQGSLYKILVDNLPVGAICVFWKEEGTQFWISPMFILPEFQGKGVAQKTIILIGEMFPQAITWELATILEEERNCYLYEKMGFIKTGIKKKLNDNTTLVFYKKICRTLPR
jgi:GNAT superfamily N-acetyltransferase